MGMVRCCDRCLRVGDDLVKVFEFELCAGCTTDLRAWIRASAKSRFRNVRKRIPSGEPWRIISGLIAQSGHVTPEQYGEVTGKLRRDAYYALQSFVKRGLLVHVSLENGAGAFALAEESEAAQ